MAYRKTHRPKKHYRRKVKPIRGKAFTRAVKRVVNRQEETKVSGANVYGHTLYQGVMVNQEIQAPARGTLGSERVGEKITMLGYYAKCTVKIPTTMSRFGNTLFTAVLYRAPVQEALSATQLLGGTSGINIQLNEKKRYEILDYKHLNLHANTDTDWNNSGAYNWHEISLHKRFKGGRVHHIDPNGVPFKYRYYISFIASSQGMVNNPGLAGLDIVMSDRLYFKDA